MKKKMKFIKPKINPKASGMDSMATKKMTSAQIAQRKRKTISNVASKVMGGQYSK